MNKQEEIAMEKLIAVYETEIKAIVDEALDALGVEKTKENRQMMATHLDKFYRRFS